MALANYPALPHTHVPTRFLGHDVEALFDWCSASLRDPDAQRAKTPHDGNIITFHRVKDFRGLVY